MRSCILFALITPLLACGDDGNPMVDARMIDARMIDAPADATPFKKYDADEGGELRVEYVRFFNAAGTQTGTGARTTAFFWEDPGTTNYFPYVSQMGCTDTTAKMHWPLATNPIAERNYLDPGGITVLGGPMPYVIPRATAMANDPFGRSHPANEWFRDPATAVDMDGANFLTGHTRYDVVFSGSAEIGPAQVFDDVLYMPADFAITTPGLTAYALTAADHTFGWDVQTQTPPTAEDPDYRVFSLVGFTGANGPAVVCIEPNDGSITVPAAMATVARTAYPSGGTMARQTLSHITKELVVNGTKTGRRIDFIAVWCYASAFTVP
jgi:hypothetical protein